MFVSDKSKWKIKIIVVSSLNGKSLRSHESWSTETMGYYTTIFKNDFMIPFIWLILRANVYLTKSIYDQLDVSSLLAENESLFLNSSILKRFRIQKVEYYNVNGYYVTLILKESIDRINKKLNKPYIAKIKFLYASDEVFEQSITLFKLLECTEKGVFHCLFTW